MNLKHSKTDRNDPRFRALVQEVGIMAYGVYWYFVEEMYEGRKLKNGKDFVQTFAFLFKIQPGELENIINNLLKFGVLIEVEGELRTQDYNAAKQKLSSAGIGNAKRRWKDNPVKQEEPKKVEALQEEPKQEPEKKGDSLEEKIKQALAKKAAQAPQEAPKASPVRKTQEPKNNTVSVAVTDADLAELDKLEEVKEPPIKEAEILPLFNEIKKLYKPLSKGNNALTKGDRSNMKTLLSFRYTKDDFTRVIHEIMKSKYVQDQGLDTPGHLLRPDNFLRYLNKSEKTVSTGFAAVTTDKPIFK